MIDFELRFLHIKIINSILKKEQSAWMSRRETYDSWEIYALNQSVIIISLYKVAFRIKIQKPRATSTRFP